MNGWSAMFATLINDQSVFSFNTMQDVWQNIRQQVRHDSAFDEIKLTILKTGSDENGNKYFLLKVFSKSFRLLEMNPQIRNRSNASISVYFTVLTILIDSLLASIFGKVLKFL